MNRVTVHALEQYVPKGIESSLPEQSAIPRLARDPKLIALVEHAIQRIPTVHDLRLGDARDLSGIPDESVHLVVTSPPYWTLKEYRQSPGQLGFVSDYQAFNRELNRVWEHCYSVLVPGGRLVIVVGDVCLSRKRNGGRHTVVPLHASIQEGCRAMGFDNLAPIIWYKIANAVYEVDSGGGFLGKPYEPNAVIKNDIEFILMQRKPGGYRKPTAAARVLSVVSSENHKRWFQQIWSDVTGASTKAHPAPYPLQLAERLVRMFSFVGDTVLDPFLGTGTTSAASLRWGRNSIGVEIDPVYLGLAQKRVDAEAAELFRSAEVRVITPGGKHAQSAKRASSVGGEALLADAERSRPTTTSRRARRSGKPKRSDRGRAAKRVQRVGKVAARRKRSA